MDFSSLTSVLANLTSPAATSTSSAIPTKLQLSSAAPDTPSSTPPRPSDTPSSSTNTTHTTPPTSSSPPPTSTPPPPSSSSSAPPSPPSSSQPGIPTTLTSSITVYVNGSPSVFPSAIATTISESTTSSSGERSAIIGGSAAGGAALIILILTLAFCIRRKRFKRLNLLDRITRRRQQAYTRANLLDGEDDPASSSAAPTLPRMYSDYETPWDARAAPASPFTGAPPHQRAQLIDTLSSARSQDVAVDLGRIVDDVMGPATSEGETQHHFSAQSVSSMHRGSMAGTDGQVHSRTVSNASHAALLEAAGLGLVRSSPLAQPEPRGDGPPSSSV